MSIRLAVCNDWYDKKSAVFWNKDGFLKMLSVLRDRDRWEIVFFKKHERTFEWEHDYVKLSFSPDPVAQIREWKPDCILGFSDFSREYLKQAQGIAPIALCYSGGLYTNYETIPDLVFVESRSYVDWMKSRGTIKRVVQAFGTNTELFKPVNQPKYWDAIFPATFASWKRHWLFGEALGARGLTCGWWQENDTEAYEACMKYGTGTLHHQLPESLVQLYGMARTCVVTSNTFGGSQRTVLEAMACNVPVIVMSDSDKTTEYVEAAGEGAIVEPDANKIRAVVEEWKDRKVNTREWIMQNYSETVYANKVKEGILSIC